MSEGAGVLRSEASLTETLGIIERLKTHISTTPKIENWEASNLYLLASAILRSALARKETRGSHWRSDFPEKDPLSTFHITQQLDQSGNWIEGKEALR
jgi:L-aspartate oxidase